MNSNETALNERTSGRTNERTNERLINAGSGVGV